ncbi:MAG: adenosylcobalamin-dependent ribonucleoside-diphosphate reductase [Candidatus Bipolaricaulota bacterium]
MSLKKVKKRDGTIVKFDKKKIVTAIQKASLAVGEGDQETSARLADKVVEDLQRIYGSSKAIPEVEDIQDIVEKVLIEQGRSATAKAYIIYRQERKQRRREKEKILNKSRIDRIDKKFSLNSLRVLASRYLLRDDEGEISESPRQLFERVATLITIPDILRDDKVFRQDGSPLENPEVDPFTENFEDYHNSYQFANHQINQWAFKQMTHLYVELNEAGQMKTDFPTLLNHFQAGDFDSYHDRWKNYFEMMVNRNFLPNSPTLMNAGTRLGQLSACFVLPMEDDMGRIMDSSKDAALIFQSGGGVGINYSDLRPEGDIVASTSGVASGPISFMRIIDTVTDVVKQGGKRRGANMGVLNIQHPDIREFIQIKEKEGTFENFNLSVGLWSSFWEAFTNSPSSQFQLRNPRNGQVVDTVEAKQLLEMIAHSAWESADPGVIFFDRINEHNVLQPAKGPIKGTNPCGEQPLYAYESCNLGSINLHNFIQGEGFDWQRYEETIRTAIRFLDNVIDMNDFPIDQIEETTKETRKIGLGVMGLANSLYERNIPYDSEDGYRFMNELAETLTYVAMDESVQLAKERGSFPRYHQSGYPEGEIPVAGYYESKYRNEDWQSLIKKAQTQGIRNAAHTTIAPTGSISMIGDTSNGIEPEFSLAYEKRVTAGNFYYANEVFEKQLKKRGLFSEELLEKVSENYGMVNGLDEIPEDLKRTFVTAMNIHYSDHIMAQAVWQKWISASISKTINMPKNATVEDVFRSYLLAHELGLKGITVYRDGSKSKQVLNMKGDRTKRIASEPSNYVRGYLRKEIDSSAMESELSELLVKTPPEESESLSETPENGSSSNYTPSGKSPDPSGQEGEEDACPVCGGKVIHEGGCNKCMECGWSVCSLS